MSDTTTTIEALVPDPRNRRKHTPRNLAMIATSLREIGAGRSIVIDEGNEVLAGNGVVASASEAGITKVRIIEAEGDELIAVRRRGLTTEQNDSLALYDNRAAELAVWDGVQLAADMEAGLDLSAYFDPIDLRRLIGTVAGRQDPNIIPEERATTIEAGQVYALGRHRVLCGDCTEAGSVLDFLGAARAALCFTSPPYAEQRAKQYGGIAADRYVEWWASVQRAIRPALLETGHFVINIKPHAHEQQRLLYVFDLVTAMVRDHGWLFVDEFCWLRTGIPQQVRNRFKNAFEPCYWFAVAGDYRWYPEAVQHLSDDVPVALGAGAGDTNAAKRQGKGGGAIQGNTIAAGLAYPSNVLDFKQHAEAIGHPAAFPVQLPAFFVACLSASGDVVIDPFGGSGTTLMACEAAGRSAYVIERHPPYCQITIDRWEGLTGLKAERVR